MTSKAPVYSVCHLITCLYGMCVCVCAILLYRSHEGSVTMTSFQIATICMSNGKLDNKYRSE